eukprot:gnl/TRDRNA2_/TRDRNA2_189901_c0_seq1.p1 gnl/TRDRNA2_/TRDRNA2_189901_c0~~gnl/TRDRNA2_/TRDRNA2_189901_c0_seq1.p1  ORF type:complete len:579 (+),score=117.25 gnl/TRDRNA2_/TRDRNA2_189901_c0_seq1:242-1738(+)
MWPMMWAAATDMVTEPQACAAPGGGDDSCFRLASPERDGSRNEEEDEAAESENGTAPNRSKASRRRHRQRRRAKTGAAGEQKIAGDDASPQPSADTSSSNAGIAAAPATSAPEHVVHKEAPRLIVSTPAAVTPAAAEPSAALLLSTAPAGGLVRGGSWLKCMPTVPESDGEEEDGGAHGRQSATELLRAYHVVPQLADVAPAQLAEDDEKSKEIIARLEDGSRLERKAVLLWLRPALRDLALSRCGCRVVQKALDVAGGPDRDRLVAELQPHVVELYESLHGNHVLAKIVEVMPSGSVGFVVRELLGRAMLVAKHRFGCRVLERLIEHCSEPQIAALVDEIVSEAETLCRHPYGNFVIQHLLEHGAPDCRASIVRRMLPFASMLSMHRTASHVIQRALDYSDEDGQRQIVETLLCSKESGFTIVDVASSRYGSFVVEQIASVRSSFAELRSRLLEGISQLSRSQFSKRVIDRYGLQAAVPATTEPTSVSHQAPMPNLD